VSPDNARETLYRFMRGARRRLAIYDARLEDPSFLALLRERAAAGVEVQVIGRAARLDAGKQVRMLKDLRLHVRAVIRDGTRAFVGSQSLRRLELDRRREVGLIITNPTVVRRMLAIFDQDWEAAAPTKKEDKKEEPLGKDHDAKSDKSPDDDKSEKAGKAVALAVVQGRAS